MSKLKKPDWRGHTVVCVASGPSLTTADCEAVHAAGHAVVVTNTSFRLCPWADALFGFDAKWWNHHADEVRRDFGGGRRLSVAQTVQKIEVETTRGCEWFKGQGNSGVCAIAWALAGEPERVILLGYDCSFDAKGRTHHHGDHPLGMSNCLSIKRWPHQFAQIAHEARRLNVPVLNASRATALTCFPRVTLEEALCGVPA